MSNVDIVDMKVGTGREAKAGNKITVDYVGTFPDGKKFDASDDHGTHFTFTLGAGQVIKGWDMGMLGMKAGGVRKLTVPPEFAYGANGAGDVVPPNSTLNFEISLLEVLPF